MDQFISTCKCDLNIMDIESIYKVEYFQIRKGKKYNCTKESYIIAGVQIPCVIVIGDMGKFSFSSSEFYEYFHTEKEIRLLKLHELNKKKLFTTFINIFKK